MCQWGANKKNVKIREELETVPVLEYTEERQQSWWGHMSEEHVYEKRMESIA